MTTQTEALSVVDALKLALEAAEIGLANLASYQSSGNSPTIHEYGQAARALAKVRAAKEVLAQPEQKSVGLDTVYEIIIQWDEGGGKRSRRELARRIMLLFAHAFVEPVPVHQFRTPYSSDWYDGIPDHHDGHGPYEIRTLYTTPPQRKPLTDEQIAAIVAKDRLYIANIWFARAIEAAHGIKE